MSDYTLPTRGKFYSFSRWDVQLCMYVTICTYSYPKNIITICTYSYSKNIIQFRFQTNWKWNNNYSNSNVQYNTNLLNILNKEINKKRKYGFDLISSLNENSYSITIYMNFRHSPKYVIIRTTKLNHRVDSVIESSLCSKIMHLIIPDETFVRGQYMITKQFLKIWLLYVI